MASSLQPSMFPDEGILHVANTPTVLLLDDDAGTLIALHAILDRTNATVIECRDERSALKSCEEQSARIDLFVADVILPISNGPEVVRKARLLQPEMRLLFISGFSVSELRRRGLLSEEDLISGEVEFLQKPFAPEIFLSTVQNLLRPIS
jgi:hypothetical protein